MVKIPEVFYILSGGGLLLQVFRKMVCSTCVMWGRHFGVVLSFVDSLLFLPVDLFTSLAPGGGKVRYTCSFNLSVRLFSLKSEITGARMGFETGAVPQNFCSLPLSVRPALIALPFHHHLVLVLERQVIRYMENCVLMT